MQQFLRTFSHTHETINSATIQFKDVMKTFNTNDCYNKSFKEIRGIGTGRRHL